MRILTYSTLFPNPVMPHHGIFVRNRLRRMVATGAVEAQVVAPVPWFPFRAKLLGSYSAYSAVPQYEVQDGLAVAHPRYPVIPKIGMTAAPHLLYQFSRRAVQRIRDVGFDFDLIDAHYFFPDGVAAARLKRELGRPLVITARGTDINLIPRYPKPRAMIQEAIAEADAIIAVCAALKDALVELGAPPEKVTVLRNGVDLDFFSPASDRAALRTSLGLEGVTLLSVGHLIERKGHHLVIEALADLPGCRLCIAGSGEEERRLRRLTERLVLSDRVRVLGALDQSTLRDYYRAADVLVLASSREGWANVLLEAMACGTPVVASPVWGTPEVVADPAAGRLMTSRSAGAIVEAVRELLHRPPDRVVTRSYAEAFGWDPTINGQIDIFNRAITGVGAYAPVA